MTQISPPGATTRLQIRVTRMQLEQCGLLYRKAGDETLAGDVRRMQHLMRVVVAKPISDGGA